MTGKLNKVYRYIRDLWKSSGEIGLQLPVAERYALFRTLLTANNNALQAMAELEKLYYSGSSYRMSDVRSKVMTMLVNIYKMIDSLVEMSGGRYTELDGIYEKIKNAIDASLSRQSERVDGPWGLALKDIRFQDSGLVGGKMSVLGEISRLRNIRVPPGFAVTASATRYFLTDEFLSEVNRKLQTLETADIGGLHATCEYLQQCVLDLEVPDDLKDQILEQYNQVERETEKGVKVAVRSSAFGEDSAGTSFAGLYRTLLQVTEKYLEESYKKIIASKYSARAIAYRRKRGFRQEDVEMCVGVLAMVDGVAGGVAYSRYPISEGVECININATKGIARGVVDGTVETELYRLGRVHPYREIVSTLGGWKEENSLLDAYQLKELAEAVLSLEEYFKEPQDVEWAFDPSNRLYILQSRPFQSRAGSPPATAAEDIQVVPVFDGGICAGRGRAAGCVYRGLSPGDITVFPENGVLVVDYPLPDWAPLLGRSIALLAEHGSEAGHLATVAREFGIPAVFGLAGVLKRLENGAIVTVDGDHGRVYEGVVQEILKNDRPKRDIMAGSPVQHIVSEALQYITPLNLNDPGSYQFKPSWCETLHDITRFCHEKSVSEMFQAGESAEFDVNKAKRLVAHTPLEWWVINLADGFREGVGTERRNIHIDDIESLPMLAIWSGITAFPWAGPPPISARGFGSIILQSAMRPDLDPAVASKLTAKNYFLISRNFCNLSVRLGYHYAMIESYVSDLKTESYITFRFKGGAADMQRKSLRARLLYEVLERYNFSVQLQSDVLLARIKKESRPYLEERLKVLGYLTLHTRQLDMVMDKRDAVAHYKRLFCKEIDSMLSRFSPDISA